MPKEADPICDSDSSSADEGDNNKSFVKKVRSHVTGLLPSKLSKWLGAKSRQRDDEEEDNYELQPPPKRAKTHNLDFEMNNIATSFHSQLCNPFSQEFLEPVPGPSLTTRRLVLPAANHYNQNQTDQTNGIDSDSSESTSGYSSMPRIGSKEQVSELPGHSNVLPNHNNNTLAGNKSIFNTSIPLERSLFGEHYVSPKKVNASLSSRRPSFDASAFGAPNFVDKTLSTRRIFNSPFYSGRITYGGASAYNRSILNASPEQVPQSPTVQPKLVNENKNVALSKTAKRILDTLEQYTSPAQDVRRIPTERRTQRPEGLIGRYIGANPYTVRDVPKLPSNKELQVPTTSDLLKMKLKERLQDSTSSMREMTRHSNSPLNAEEYSIRNSDDDKQGVARSTNKIKTKVSSVRQRSIPDDETLPEVKLPNVQLPISTLPSFNFSIPFVTPESAKKPIGKQAPSLSDKTNSQIGAASSEVDATSKTNGSASAAITSPAVNSKAPDVQFKSSWTASPVSKVCALPKSPSVLQEAKQLVTITSTNVEYRFSKPLVIAENKFNSIKAINNFKFSDPVVKKVLNGLSEPQGKKITKLSEVVLPKSGFGDMFKADSDKWECSACMVKNISSATTCISCTTPKVSAKPTINGPAKLASVATAPSWGDKFKAPTNNWTCTVCMISNDPSKEKCAACESPKPAPAASSASSTKKVTGFEGFAKKADGQECPNCMVNTKEKCICCNAAKSGAKSMSAAPVKQAVVSSWGDKFKAPSTTWECSMCMIRNDMDKDRCAACENSRPAGVAPLQGIDGFKKNSEWECTSCMVRNPTNKEKCVCCEAPNPGSKPLPTAQVRDVPKFSFGIENGLINGQGFMFGIPAGKNVVADEKKSDAAPAEKTNVGSSCTQFLFGIKHPNGAKPSLPSMPAKVPEVAPTAEAEPIAVVPSFSFGIPTGTKRSATSDEADSVKTSKKPDSDVTLSNPIINGNLSKTEAAKTEPPKFTFGAINNTPAANMASNLFSTVESTKPAELIAPAFGAITTTATPAFSFTASASKPAVPKSDASAAFSALETTFGASVADKPATPVFRFNSAASPAPAATSMFSAGAAAPNGPAPTFNFSATKAPVKPGDTIPQPFKFSATNSAKSSVFGGPGSATPTFASASGTTAMFGAPASNVITFGAPSTQAAAVAAPTFGANLGFAGNVGPGTFGGDKAAAPGFGSSVPPPAYSASSSTFSKPTSNGVFSFGASNDQTNESKPALGFGVPAATMPTFTFGASANTQNTNGAFNFGGNDKSSIPTFNATAKPAINFTAGAPTTAFSAQPLETKAAPPGRLIRRAVRRTQR